MTGLKRFTNNLSALILGWMFSFKVGDEVVSESWLDVYHCRGTRFGGAQVMKLLQTGMIALLSMLALSGCSAQMMAGMDDSEEYKNLAAGDAFLAENKNKEGVVELFSGMQYKVIQEGMGPMPKINDKVSIHYTGKTLRGEVFDRTQGFPRTYPVKAMFSGMQMAITRMNEGAKWEVYLPPEFAFGERGNGPVGPNSTVIYEIELVKVN